MSSAIEIMLRDLKVTRREAALYIALLEDGGMNLNAVARKTGIGKDHAKAALERLAEKRFVDLSPHDGRYAAKDPIELKRMLKKKELRFILFDHSGLP